MEDAESFAALLEAGSLRVGYVRLAGLNTPLEHLNGEAAINVRLVEGTTNRYVVQIASTGMEMVVGQKNLEVRAKSKATELLALPPLKTEERQGRIHGAQPDECRLSIDDPVIQSTNCASNGREGRDGAKRVQGHKSCLQTN
jgi:hypothetical protein